MDRAVAKVQLDQSGFESLKEELGPSRDASLRRDASLDITYDEQDIMKVRARYIHKTFRPLL
jgi:ankyrin